MLIKIKCYMLFFIFLSLLYSPWLYLFDRKYSTKLVILWNIFTLKITISDLIYLKKICYLFLFIKLNFQHQNVSLQCQMIIQKPFEYTDLVLNKYVFIYYSRIFLLLVNIFVETVIQCCSIIWIMFVYFFYYLFFCRFGGQKTLYH